MASLQDLTAKYNEAIGRRTTEFNGMSERELAIYKAGQQDGSEITADRIQPVLTSIENASKGLDQDGNPFNPFCS